MKMVLSIGVMLAVALLVGTAFSGSVYAKVPERLDTIGKVQNKINHDFMAWYTKSSKRLGKLNEYTVKSLFVHFLEENPNEKRYLNILTYLQKKQFVGAKNGNDRIVTSKKFVIEDNGPHFMSVRETIHYFKLHIAWWTITYGEEDKIENLFWGSDAKAFFDEFEQTTSEYSEMLFIASLALVPFSANPIAGALSAAFAVAGFVIDYMHDNMANYYMSVHMKYLWLVFKNDYYYPWISVISLASSIGYYGYNKDNHHYTTIFPNIPWVAYGGYGGVFYSAYVSGCVHKFINKYGTGWVDFWR